MMYHPIEIANYFINKSFDVGHPITPMKLVKLVYVAHGWHLALADKSLISEGVQAWKYGPVIPSVYHAFKRFGSNYVTRMDSTFLGTEIDKNTVDFLDRIWEVYLKFNGVQMSSITHEKGTPWSKTWYKAQGRHEVIISNDLIKEYYKGKIDGSE